MKSRFIAAIAVFAASQFAFPVFGQQVRLECLVADPPLSCIEDLTGTPSIGPQGSILKEQLSIDMRLQRFDQLTDKTFELKEGMTYQAQ